MYIFFIDAHSRDSGKADSEDKVACPTFRRLAPSFALVSDRASTLISRGLRGFAFNVVPETAMRAMFAG